MDDIPVAPLPESPRMKSTAGVTLPTPPKPPEPARRGFLYQLFAGVVGALTAVVPLAAGVAVYLDPLRRTKAAGTFIPVTTLDAIPDSSAGDVLLGQFPVVADRLDLPAR